MNAIANQIRATFNLLWSEDHDCPPPPLDDDTVLLETGFDSMAFAVLIAQLDDDLGVDPFSIDPDAEPPTTFAEFVGFYTRLLQAEALEQKPVELSQNA
ncbi:phosphopantetheine-binding protein [Novosphingobium cyanobacteriorum]|uniref:Phosphopantetheine-binding protein n=1 Tax=Novosphingobium cyanobacteriorum TaxID=3024215 RepID=A0ABT6CMN6_9SPHN|nr:phosphopantetheine-binding protein [Novosphingobium cyanobacteriorum]MDF8335184.1 phosphopantetheine-binding protein [Novosphingobium cyanobacteriorum]